MIGVRDPRDCCGCTACASICAHDAITMNPDALGFLYPKVDATLCVECGLCEKVCQFNDSYDRTLNLLKPEVFAARHKDVTEVMKSRSGAVFAAVSDFVLENGGVVYGAGYADHFRVVHKKATTKTERDEFRGSKYVQSDLTGVFRQVKDDLRKGLTVLFSGTPCQTSGLNSYIGKKLRENLILVDIVCHGVPSPYVWRDYLLYLEKKQGCTIKALNFRNKKKFGYKGHKETFCFEGESKERYYLFEYYKSYSFRRSCEVCHFANVVRPSDMTLADYWGSDSKVKKFNSDDKGCSLVFVNSGKGKEVFNLVRDRLTVLDTTLEKSLQPNLRTPSKKHPQREQFEADYVVHGFEYVTRKYGNMGANHWKKNILLALKFTLKRIVANIK